MKIRGFIWKVAVLLLFMGCKTTPKFEGRGDLCGLVIDDFNNPVSGFVVTCRNNLNLSKNALTNESGFFVFTDLPSDVYFISGHKENYVELKEVEYAFFDRSKIFCCQILNADSAFDKVENLILLENYQECMELLESIHCEKPSNVLRVLTLYKEKIKAKLEESCCNETIEIDS